MIAVIIISFFICLFIGFPIAIAMGVAGAIGIVTDPSLSAVIVSQKLHTGFDSFALMAMPFFMLAGQIMEHTGITERLVDLAKRLVGWMRGGLAYTTIVSGVLMAGISGSANADAAAIGALTLGPMRRDGWSEGQSVAVVASAGGLGPIIPPSIPMIIFCNLTSISVGKMFVAGYIPGILLALGYMAIAGYYAKKHNLSKTKFEGFGILWKTFKGAIWALLMPIIILGGILSGICTATEAGILAVLYGTVYGFATNRLKFKQLSECLYNAVLNSGGPMLIIGMATILGYELTRYNFGTLVGDFVLAYAASPVAFLMIVIVMLIIAGMFIDGTATMMMLLPILVPISKALGIDQIQFAMVFFLALQTGGLTPPVGALLFIVSSVGKTPLGNCVKPIIPFVGVMAIAAMLIIFIPEIATFLPNLLGYA